MNYCDVIVTPNVSDYQNENDPQNLKNEKNWQIRNGGKWVGTASSKKSGKIDEATKQATVIIKTQYDVSQE